MNTHSILAVATLLTLTSHACSQEEFIKALEGRSTQPLFELENKARSESFQLFATKKAIEISKISEVRFTPGGATEFQKLLEIAGDNISNKTGDGHPNPEVRINTIKSISKLVSLGEVSDDGSQIVISSSSVDAFRKQIESDCFWPFCPKK